MIMNNSVVVAQEEEDEVGGRRVMLLELLELHLSQCGCHRGGGSDGAPRFARRGRGARGPFGDGGCLEGGEGLGGGRGASLEGKEEGGREGRRGHDASRHRRHERLVGQFFSLLRHRAMPRHDGSSRKTGLVAI